MKRIERGFDLFVERTLERLQSIAIGSLARGRRRQGGDGGIPAREFAGGEGQGVREHQRVMAHLLGVLGKRKEGRRRDRDDGQG